MNGRLGEKYIKGGITEQHVINNEIVSTKCPLIIGKRPDLHLQESGKNSKDLGDVV